LEDDDEELELAEALSENQDEDDDDDGLSSGEEEEVADLVSDEELLLDDDDEDDDAADGLVSALNRSKNFCSSGSKLSLCLGAGGGCDEDLSLAGDDGWGGDGDAQSQPMMTVTSVVFALSVNMRPRDVMTRGEGTLRCGEAAERTLKVLQGKRWF
jgi:hypothetical protein